MLYTPVEKLCCRRREMFIDHIIPDLYNMLSGEIFGKGCDTTVLILALFPYTVIVTVAVCQVVTVYQFAKLFKSCLKLHVLFVHHPPSLSLLDYDVHEGIS
jgi:hypothetical protein